MLKTPLEVVTECLRVNPNESPEGVLAALDAAGYVLTEKPVKHPEPVKHVPHSAKHK